MTNDSKGGPRFTGTKVIMPVFVVGIALLMGGTNCSRRRGHVHLIAPLRHTRMPSAALHKRNVVPNNT